MLDGSPATLLDTLEHDPASWLADRVDDPRVADRARAAVRSAIDTAGPDRVRRSIAEALRAGPSEGVSPADPVIRSLFRAWIGAIASSFEVSGLERILSDRPTILVSNHLSYVDTTATDCALLAAGASGIADRITALAGPKVWETPLHALATRGLNVIPTVQSRSVGGEGARAAAAQLIRAVALARERLGQGPLLVYAEGTRSRSGRLGPFLKGVRHYLHPGAVVIPVALQGTDRLYPIDAPKLFEGPIRLALGEPIEIADPQQALEASFQAIADLLPEPYRPSGDTPAVR